MTAATGDVAATRHAAAALLVMVMLAATGCGLILDRDEEPVVVTVTEEPSPDGPDSSDASDAPTVTLVEHEGNRYKVVALPLDAWELRVDWGQNVGGQMLEDVIADTSVVVATNAGIFTPAFAPGGLLVSDGVELSSLNLADGAGNFHLKPNGVFAIGSDGTAVVVDSTAYDPAGVEFATQSGPALALDGVIHPEFGQESTNLAYRSGVGVSPDGRTVYLALAVTLTNFYDFATLFTEQLGCADALYLDGDVSRLWVAGDGKPDVFAGPYAGVITARPHT